MKIWVLSRITQLRRDSPSKDYIGRNLTWLLFLIIFMLCVMLKYHKAVCVIISESYYYKAVNCATVANVDFEYSSASDWLYEVDQVILSSNFDKNLNFTLKTYTK